MDTKKVIEIMYDELFIDFMEKDKNGIMGQYGWVSWLEYEYMISLERYILYIPYILSLHTHIVYIVFYQIKK